MNQRFEIQHFDICYGSNDLPQSLIATKKHHHSTKAPHLSSSSASKRRKKTPNPLKAPAMTVVETGM